MKWMYIACLVLVACGDGSSGGDADGGADTIDAAGGGDVDAPVANGTDAAPCTTPVDCASWLEDYESELVSKLSGNEEITTGVTITARESIAERDIVRTFLFDELNSLGLTAQLHTYATGANVYARLPATEPNPPLIVMGAHFDGIAGTPAAADDGTGTALVVAAARYLSQVAERRAEVIFVLFDEEEVGLIGSQEFAEKLRLDLEDVEAVHVFDMISFDGDADGAAELWSPDPTLQGLYEAEGAVRGIPIRVVEFSSSDHASFIGNNFDTVGVSEEFVSGDHTPHYHTPQDTYDKIDFAYLGSITRLILAVVSDQLAVD
jgi:hypothetical protein